MAKKLLRKNGFDLSRQRKILHDTLAEVGVYCLSELNDNILMWSHYANCHRGYCLVFRSHLVRGASGVAQLTASALPIIYSDVYPVVNPIIDNNKERLEKSILTKSNEWSYEKEWRSIDHEGGSGIKKIDPSFIVGVIFGCRISTEDEKILRDLSQKSPSTIRLFRAVMHEQQYALEIHPAD